MRVYTSKTNQQIADYINAHWYTRTIKANKKQVYYDGWDISNRRTDPFYYGKLTHGNIETRLPDKYNFTPMITEEEHFILCEKYLDDRRWVRLAKDDTDLQHILDAFDKHTLKNPEWRSMTVYIGKKKQMEQRINEAIASWIKFKYLDKVPKSYIRYKTDGNNFEVTYKDLEPQIIGWLKKINITPELYEQFGSTIHEEHRQKNEEITIKIKAFEDHLKVIKRQKSDYMTNALGKKFKDNEEELYDNKVKEFNDQIAKIKSLLSELDLEEEVEDISYESFFLTLSNAHKYYIMSDMVRRRRILSILASNFSVDSQKKLTITPKPGLEVLFSPVNKKIRRQGFEPW